MRANIYGKLGRNLFIEIQIGRLKQLKAIKGILNLRGRCDRSVCDRGLYASQSPTHTLSRD
jgi:hypothetical protein